MESNCATTAPNSWSSSKGADSQRHVAAMMEASFSLSSAGSGRDTGGSGGSRVDMLDMSVIDEGQDGAGTHLTGGHGRLDLEVAGADAEQPAAGRQSFERSAHAVFHFSEARVAILAGYRVCQPNLDADAARTLRTRFQVAQRGRITGDGVGRRDFDAGRHIARRAAGELQVGGRNTHAFAALQHVYRKPRKLDSQGGAIADAAGGRRNPDAFRQEY